MNLLDSIDQLESHFQEIEPIVLAFIPEDDRFNRLRNEAEELLVKYPDSETRPALFGELVGVKDIFHVDGFPTKAGSNLPLEILVGEEAKSVSKLKKHGALIVGKTVTTEFAYFAPGPTRNPNDYAHTPGGSSSGSAAAVAAGFCSIGLGTQTIGSVIRPAAFCGVVGFKPSYDRISRDGVIPLSPSVDHVGIFTKDVEKMIKGAAPFLNRINPTDFDAQKIVLGIPEGPYLNHASKTGREHFLEVCSHLQDSGIEIKNVASMKDFHSIFNRHSLIVAAEAAIVHNEWFQLHEDKYHQKTSELIKLGQTISEEKLNIALQGREKLRNELAELMKINQIDFWISPSALGPAPKGLESTGDPIMNLPWTHAGLPTLNLPSGFTTKGLPLGLQITGGWNQDEALLEASQKLENILKVRVDKV